MKWFRSKLRHGSRVAIFALAVQFALSFGHFHGVVTSAPVALSLSVQQQQPASDHDSNRHPDDACAICAVMAMANAVVFATPPALLLPQATEFSPLAIDDEFVLVNSVRAAFQPRAPPIS
ncbi:MAG TPA: DUF2946 family protein [Bradyrhizobium sp.]|nr:DUF2946 family protein [Bradyrhizobium sp.]